jgi:hypothetical protein
MRKDPAGRWISKGLDLASANMYGNTIIIWPPDTSVFARTQLEQEALDVAKTYSADRGDYVMVLGSPSLSVILAWAIGSLSKPIRVLEWDRDMRRYYPTLGDSVAQVLSRERAANED